MATTAELKVLADVQTSIKEFKKFQKSTERSFNGIAKSAKASQGSLLSVDGSIKTLTRTAGLLGGALLGAFAARKLISGISSITEAAGKQEAALQKIITATKVSGEFSSAAITDFENFASAIQQTTTVGDEAVLAQLALAKSFGATNKQAKEVLGFRRARGRGRYQFN